MEPFPLLPDAAQPEDRRLDDDEDVLGIGPVETDLPNPQDGGLLEDLLDQP